MENKTKIVCCGNMKGGVGKSTTTMLIATELCLQHHHRIILLDCDEQATISKTRVGDKAANPKWPAPYEIIKVALADVIKKIASLKASNEYDFIFIDMPRITEDLDNEAISFDIVQLLAVLDVLFIPFIANTMDLQATQDFMSYVLDVASWKESKQYKFKYIGFQNKRENAIENKDIEQWAKFAKLPLMDNYLKKNNLISRQYSTYFSLQVKSAGKQLLQNFINEINQILID